MLLRLPPRQRRPAWGRDGTPRGQGPRVALLAGRRGLASRRCGSFARVPGPLQGPTAASAGVSSPSPGGGGGQRRPPPPWEERRPSAPSRERLPGELPPPGGEQRPGSRGRRGKPPRPRRRVPGGRRHPEGRRPLGPGCGRRGPTGRRAGAPGGRGRPVPPASLPVRVRHSRGMTLMHVVAGFIHLASASA